MATYFLRCKHISRGKGARATRAAAYRSGERILDERSGDVHDHSGRHDIAYKEVVLPADLTGRADMAWTQDRSRLWNAAEHAGLRRNSRVAREWLVFVPPELTHRQRVDLVRSFAGELADRYRCAVDVCLHEPRPGADPRNHHAHLMMTTREVSPEGMGRRTALEMGGRERHLAGLGPTREEYLRLRARWGEVTNSALQEAGITAHIDHRSLAAQGIDREPTPTVPEKVFYAERKAGAASDAGAAIRARHRERLEAREKNPADLARVIARQKQELKQGAIAAAAPREREPQIPWSALTRDERNQRRNERSHARRAIEKQDPVREAQRREQKRLAAQARQRAKPEMVRAARTRWRHANTDDVNRKQREYRAARAQIARAKSLSATAETAAQNWQTYRARAAPGPTAEEAALAWRGAQGQKTSGTSPSPAVATPELERTHEKGPQADFGL